MISNDFLGDPGGMEPLKVEPQDMEDFEEIEPLPRDRSNTWPLQRPTNDTQTSPLIHTEIPELNESGENGSYESLDHLASLEGGAEGSTSQKKTNTSRRNAWGNFSYADLITQAVISSPEKRLTLSQIYDWMVQNVPYFRDKGDSNSSAGWKNSIRHNLSLHNRFMRVQNEGAGKSSWWVINPEAKPGKSSRRRAGSMETKTLEKKRGRAKKKVDQLRMEGGHLTPAFSESSDLSSTFSLSPNEFRHRSDSNVSSYSTGGLVNGGLHSPLGGEDEFEPHKLLGQNMPGAHELFPDIADALTQSMNINESAGLTLAAPYSQPQSAQQQQPSVQQAPMTPQHQQKPPPSYVAATISGRLVYLAPNGSPSSNGTTMSPHQSPNKMGMRGPGTQPQMLSVECNSPVRAGYVVSQISPQPGTQICSQPQQNATPPYGLKQEPPGAPNPPAYQELYPVHLNQHGVPNSGGTGGGGLSNNPILRDALIHKCGGAAMAANVLLHQQHNGGVNLHQHQSLQGGQFYPVNQPNGTNLPSELCEISYDSVQSHFSTIDIAPYLESLSGGIGSDFDTFDNIGQL